MELPWVIQGENRWYRRSSMKFCTGWPSVISFGRVYVATCCPQMRTSSTNLMLASPLDGHCAVHSLSRLLRSIWRVPNMGPACMFCIELYIKGSAPGGISLLRMVSVCKPSIATVLIASICVRITLCTQPSLTQGGTSPPSFDCAFCVQIGTDENK